MRRMTQTAAVAMIGLTFFLHGCINDIQTLKEQAAKNTAQVLQLSKDIDAGTAMATGLESSVAELKKEIAKAEAGQLRDKLAAILTKTEARLNDVNTKVAKYSAKKNEVVAEVEKINTTIQKAETQQDLVAGLVAQYAHFIPPPYGTAVALGVPFLLSMFWGKKQKNGRTVAEADAKENKRKGIAMTRNIDAVIADPNLSGGPGKFDANDPATAARLKELDRAAGVTDWTAEAMQ